MEILGLAVIVIFIAIGMFFVAKFALTPSTNQQAQSFQQANLATNFINALLYSKTNCTPPITFTALLEDIPNQQFSLIKCGDGTLLEYFNSSVRSILNETLDVWGYNYEMRILFPAGYEDSDLTINKGCLPTMQRDQKLYPVPTDYGTIQVEMSICF